jgi:hypothetical protein
MSISVLEKNIYNSYLYSLAKFKNRPFKRREDFSKLEDEKIGYLKKLSSFFTSHSHINIDMFMDAPFKVYSEKDYYPLEFYSKPIALKTYFLYINMLDEESPDSHDNLILIKDSLIFIKNFCVEKKITLKEYLSYSDSATFAWCNHLLNNDICIYNILAFSFFNINIYMLLNQLPMDEKELFLHQYNGRITEYMKKLNDSGKAKTLLLKGYKKVKKNVECELQS